MISDEVFAFLVGGKSLVLGTRDAALVPEAARGVGLVPWPDRKHVSVFIPEQPAARTLANLHDNGRLAVTVSYPPDHRTLQLKGRAVAFRAASEQERTLVSEYVAQFAEVLDQVGMPAHLIQRMNHWPCQRVDVLVEEIYQQTPGPGAGARLGEVAP